MGIGYTIDTPIKVAHYGISSVISLVDDMLIEKMRAYHSERHNKPFKPISDKIDDFRAKRITAYLDLVDEIVREKFAALKQTGQDRGSEIQKYMAMLPDQSALKDKFHELAAQYDVGKAWDWIKDHLSPGKIDVNIMTKLDKENYKGKEKLPTKFSDAHAALRGFAKSNLESSVVLSAGMNPRLYGYLGEFPDFFPEDTGKLKKKIILKVSDYRSALIQGKYLAKKGLWVSEYRIESGLNCGGHAFATDGYLMGPILEEFKENRTKLREKIYKYWCNALEKKDYVVPDSPPEMKITAQGGVGTSQEHQYLQDQYGVDSVGWGSPFLLVPEVVNIDDKTKQLVSDADEEDLYLSGISPLGVPFNSVRGNTKDIEKQEWIAQDRPGSPCPKKYVVMSTEFTDKPICRASRQYQHLKLQELDEKDIDPVEYQKAHDDIIEKACICVGLGTSALLVNDLDNRVEGEAVSICPGPNMAYFSKEVSLVKMTNHIYGKENVIQREDRPHMFLKELSLYVAYLKEQIADSPVPMEEKQRKSLEKFRANLLEGIQYYRNLFGVSGEMIDSFNTYQDELESIQLDQFAIAE